MYRIFVLASIWACTAAGVPCKRGSQCRATPAGFRANVLLAIKHHITRRNPEQALREEEKVEKPTAGGPEDDKTTVVTQSKLDQGLDKKEEDKKPDDEGEQAEKPDAGEPEDDQTKVVTQGTSDQVLDEKMPGAGEAENDGTEDAPQSNMDNEAVEDEMPGVEEYQDAEPQVGEPWVPDDGDIEAGVSEAEEIKLMYQEEYCGNMELEDCEKHYRGNWETLCDKKPMLLPQEVCGRIKILITKEDKGKPKEQDIVLDIVGGQDEEPKVEEPEDDEKEQDKMLDAVGEQAEKLDAGELEDDQTKKVTQSKSDQVLDEKEQDEKPEVEGEQAEKLDAGELEENQTKNVTHSKSDQVLDEKEQDEKPKVEGEQDGEDAGFWR